MLLMALCLQISVQAQHNTFTLTSDSLKSGQSLTTYKIFFELGKAILKPESNVFLDSLATFLQTHPAIAIEISVHSDSRVSPNCCNHLTLNRAVCIRDYLLKKGIAMDRIQAKGYDEKKLLISDAEIQKAKTKEEKEALHAKNRRVEIKIVSTGN